MGEKAMYAIAKEKTGIAAKLCRFFLYEKSKLDRMAGNAEDVLLQPQ